jgi:hypothetical protein
MKKSFIIVFVWPLFLFFFTSMAWGEDWRLYFKYKDFLFYDGDNINKPYENQENILSVWEKTVYDKESLVRISGHLGDEYSDLEESRALIEIDCKNKYSQTMAITYYNTKGEIIAAVQKTKLDWKKIVADTPMDRLCRTICPRKRTNQ